MVRTYDVIVIGAGPAGENVAGRCAQAGLETALVERELVGGECSYWACMPSKTLLRPGEVLASARRVPGARQAVKGSVDQTAALERRNEIVTRYDDESQERWVEEVGARLLRGHGRLLGARSVEVTGSETRERLEARRAVVLATGSAPVVPPIEGLAEAHPWDNRGVTSATSVPRRLIALGGGVVGVEMAQAWKRLGAEEVTIIEAGERLLAHEEPFVGHQLQEAFEREGIAVMIGSPVVRVRRSNGEVRTTMEDGTSLAADELLVAVGRRPATKDLGLDSVGLEPGSPVEVDSHLAATGVDGGWLYAVGDVNGRALLTHMGKYQARVASDHITGRHGGDVDVADDRAVPRVIFTDPQVAAVGLTESAARARGMAVSTVSHDTGGVAGASVSGVGIAGTSHLVIDESRSVIVGATFTGPGVGELLHAATVAIVAEVPLERLWHAVPSYPTLSEVWLKLLEDYGL